MRSSTRLILFHSVFLVLALSAASSVKAGPGSEKDSGRLAVAQSDDRRNPEVRAQDNAILENVENAYTVEEVRRLMRALSSPLALDTQGDSFLFRLARNRNLLVKPLSPTNEEVKTQSRASPENSKSTLQRIRHLGRSLGETLGLVPKAQSPSQPVVTGENLNLTVDLAGKNKFAILTREYLEFASTKGVEISRDLKSNRSVPILREAIFERNWGMTLVLSEQGFNQMPNLNVLYALEKHLPEFVINRMIEKMNHQPVELKAAITTGGWAYEALNSGYFKLVAKWIDTGYLSVNETVPQYLAFAGTSNRARILELAVSRSHLEGGSFLIEKMVLMGADVEYRPTYYTQEGYARLWYPLKYSILAINDSAAAERILRHLAQNGVNFNEKVKDVFSHLNSQTSAVVANLADPKLVSVLLDLKVPLSADDVVRIIESKATYTLSDWSSVPARGQKYTEWMSAAEEIMRREPSVLVNGGRKILRACNKFDVPELIPWVLDSVKADSQSKAEVYETFFRVGIHSERDLAALKTFVNTLDPVIDTSIGDMKDNPLHLLARIKIKTAQSDKLAVALGEFTRLVAARNSSWLEARDRLGNTPVDLAAYSGNESQVETLIDLKARVSVKTIGAALKGSSYALAERLLKEVPSLDLSVNQNKREVAVLFEHIFVRFHAERNRAADLRQSSENAEAETKDFVAKVATKFRLTEDFVLTTYFGEGYTLGSLLTKGSMSFVGTEVLKGAPIAIGSVLRCGGIF